MKRLGIFVFFDHDGILDQYIEVLLRALSLQCHKLIAAINGKIQQESLIRLKAYTNDIFYRDNTGFDAGAYKDIFLNYFPLIRKDEFDEAVLLNDTFYGPLYSLDDIWNRFEGNYKVDFWGITRHPNGKWVDGEEIPAHIQSYFLVIKKRMLYSYEFFAFWKDMRYFSSIRETIVEFEIKFTTYFTEKGFCGYALTDLEIPTFQENGESPYLFNSYQLIRDMHVPFFKRNSLNIANSAYINALNALEYIEKNINYDVQLIWENIFRLSRGNYFSNKINYLKLEEFYNCHDKVFIYGKGRYGKNIAEYFRYRGWVNSGFIISEKQLDRSEKAYVFSDLEFEKRDGVIIAMNEEAFWEVYPKVKGKLMFSQLMILQYT